MEEARIGKTLMYFEGRINISDYLVVEKKETQEESGILGGCSRPEKIVLGIRKLAWDTLGLPRLLGCQMRVLRRQLDVQVPCTKKKSG